VDESRVVDEALEKATEAHGQIAGRKGADVRAIDQAVGWMTRVHLPDPIGLKEVVDVGGWQRGSLQVGLAVDHAVYIDPIAPDAPPLVDAGPPGAALRRVPRRHHQAILTQVRVGTRRVLLSQAAEQGIDPDLESWHTVRRLVLQGGVYAFAWVHLSSIGRGRSST